MIKKPKVTALEYSYFSRGALRDILAKNHNKSSDSLLLATNVAYDCLYPNYVLINYTC